MALKNLKGEPVIHFTDKLYDIIDDISGPVAEALMRAEADHLMENPLQIEKVDAISGKIKAAMIYPAAIILVVM